jgi:hypothetical protein
MEALRHLWGYPLFRVGEGVLTVGAVATVLLIPIARAEFTIAPLLQVPPASRGARGFGSPCLQGEP